VTEIRPPLPPFTRETAGQKVRGAEDGWNSCDPERVALVYTPDSYWRNRSEFIRGRTEIVAFLRRKWTKELDYRLIKELWAFTENRIASLPTNGMTIAKTGFVRTGMKTGSLPSMG
jgi:nuclear transport factor 2 (NTF2) superfamily protein